MGTQDVGLMISALTPTVGIGLGLFECMAWLFV